MIRAHSAWLPALLLALGGGAAVPALTACSAGGLAVSGQPSSSQPSGGQPSSGQPSSDQPSGGQPSGGQPSSGQPSGGQPPVVVRDGAGSHTATVTVGQRLELILDSNYWSVAGSSRPGVLHQDGPSATMSPASCPTIPGIGCPPVQTDFSALAPGTAVITATRSSCGEALRCGPGQRNFTLTVTVRARQ